MVSEDDCQAKSPLADISKAKEMLGYKPEVDFEQGIQKTVEYFKTLLLTID